MENKTVRCKFYCQTVEKSLDGSGASGGRSLYRYKFFAVYNGSEENKKFWAYTPSGSLEVQSVREDQFEVGKEYYLDISAAAVPA